MTHHLSEQDLQLIHGLQIAPRVSWSDAARILRTTPTTLASRWRRLRQDGLSWVTAHPEPTGSSALVAFVEVDCIPGRREDAKAALCQDARVASIEERARGGDFLLTVLAQGLTSLSRFVLDELPLVPGVLGHRTHVLKQLHYGADAWRLDALTPGQRRDFAALGAGRRPHAAPPRGSWPLIQELSRDGRAGAAEIARITGRNPATIRRQLPRLLNSGILTLRCEIAQGYSRWPINGSYFARVPAAQVNETTHALTTLPELRLCASTTGEANLVFTVWAGSMASLLNLEQRVAEHLPWLEIRDSSITLRTVKRMGWLLDDLGAATGEVIVPVALRPDDDEA